MIRMFVISLVTASLLVTQTMSQSSTDNPFDELVSAGYSIYTEVTSILPSVASAASAAVSSSSASVASNDATTTSSSSSSSSSTFPPSTSSATTSSAQSSSASVAAASATATASHGGSHHNKLAIILGSVLGVLILGLLILALLLCCWRRRRRSRDSHRSEVLSPSAEEVESWRQPTTFDGRAHGNQEKEVIGAGAVGAPLMGSHPAFRNEHENQHQNPFVPLPPPPRRSAQNSRAGLTDGTAPADPPYLVDDRTGRPLSRKSLDSHHGAGALAAGAGGAGLGAAAMHHHNKGKEPEIDEKYGYDQQVPQHHSSTMNHKPVSLNTHNPHAHNPQAFSPYAYPTPTTNDDPFAFNDSGRRSMDSSRSRSRPSRPSRDAARANAAFNSQYSSSSDEHSHHMGTAAAVGAGALGGAALAHHRRKSSGESRSPHRRSLLPSRRDHGDNSDSSNSNEYADAMPHQLHNVPYGEPTPPFESSNERSMPSGPHEMSASNYDVPPTPPTRSRRNSALGTAAPAAAAAAYVAHPHRNSRSRSRSNSSSRGREMMPPAGPPKSPHRNSYSSSPLRHSGVPTVDSDDSASSKGIVGDNGYPHIGAPRRKSGASEHRQSADIGRPQSMSPAVPNTVGGSRYPAHMAGSNEVSDDSTWRSSQGMPGGWQRSHSPAQRYSPDSYRIGSPVSPMEGDSWNQRDSLMSGSTAVGSRGGRLRLADLRREEEERARTDGKHNTQWSGNGSYDAYGRWSDHAVGQAM